MRLVASRSFTGKAHCHNNIGSGAATRTLTRRRCSTLPGDKLARPPPPPHSSSSAAATVQHEAAAATAAAGRQPLVATNGSSKAVASWLFGTAGAVAVMVTVGGITRMTKSGLSMTDWKVQGSLPPSTEVRQPRRTRCCGGDGGTITAAIIFAINIFDEHAPQVRRTWYELNEHFDTWYMLFSRTVAADADTAAAAAQDSSSCSILRSFITSYHKDESFGRA